MASLAQNYAPVWCTPIKQNWNSENCAGGPVCNFDHNHVSLDSLVCLRMVQTQCSLSNSLVHRCLHMYFWISIKINHSSQENISTLLQMVTELPFINFPLFMFFILSFGLSLALAICWFWYISTTAAWTWLLHQVAYLPFDIPQYFLPSSAVLINRDREEIEYIVTKTKTMVGVVCVRAVSRVLHHWDINCPATGIHRLRWHEWLENSLLQLLRWVDSITGTWMVVWIGD